MPGQQETYLNISGADAVLAATVKCWASLWTARAIAYRARQGIPPESVALAVVVQLLVPAEAAGILFTADPVTGRRDQVVISAAWGLGEAIVGGLVTPDSLTVDKATGRVLERQTADKQMMTVRTDDGTHEQPVPEQMRRVPVLDDAAAAELTRLAVQIEALYGMPMDIEWALGRRQVCHPPGAGPITALPSAPSAAHRMETPQPQGPVHARQRRGPAARPGQSAVCHPGDTGGLPRRHQRGAQAADPLRAGSCRATTSSTINDYLYMGVAFTPHQWWWILSRMMLSFPRILREALPLWRDEIRPRYAATVARWQGKPLESLSVGRTVGRDPGSG